MHTERAGIARLSLAFNKGEHARVFLFGHAGLGPRLVWPWRARLPLLWLTFGCLLPDLIDKPLFYFLLWTRGRPSELFSGSRTIGHTGLFLFSWFALALLSKRPAIWAIAAGIATHLLLDIGGELLTGADAETSIWLAIFYPLYGRFPVAHFGSLLEHLRLSAKSAYVIAGEIVGGGILLRDYLRRRG
jgi:hypothetical protein